MSDLDKDFAKTAEQINAKLKEAADALREATNLADEAGMEGLIYTQWVEDHLMYKNDEMSKLELKDKCEEISKMCESIHVRDFEKELNRAGWSTSSSYC